MSKCLLSVLLLVSSLVSLGAQSSMEPESEQLDELWLNYDQISTELSALLNDQEMGLAELVGRVQTLTIELETLRSELQAWRIELTELQTISETLANESRRLESDIQLLSQQIKEFEQQYSLLETQMLELQTGQNRLTWGAGISVGVAVISIILLFVFKD